MDTCTIQRRVLVKTYKWNLATNEKVLEKEEIVVGPCDTPLFGTNDRKTGVCSACSKGWSVEGNTITALGFAQIKRAIGKAVRANVG